MRIALLSTAILSAIAAAAVSYDFESDVTAVNVREATAPTPFASSLGQPSVALSQLDFWNGHWNSDSSRDLEFEKPGAVKLSWGTGYTRRSDGPFPIPNPGPPPCPLPCPGPNPCPTPCNPPDPPLVNTMMDVADRHVSVRDDSSYDFDLANKRGPSATGRFAWSLGQPSVALSQLDFWKGDWNSDSSRDLGFGKPGAVEWGWGTGYTPQPDGPFPIPNPGPPPCPLPCPGPNPCPTPCNPPDSLAASIMMDMVNLYSLDGLVGSTIAFDVDSLLPLWQKAGTAILEQDPPAWGKTLPMWNTALYFKGD